MAGLLGFLAAGAVKGAGDGIVAEAKAKREAAIAEIENNRLMAREDRSRAFQAEQGSLDRGTRLSEAQTDRAFRASEGEKDRAAQAARDEISREDTMTGENGETLVRRGDRVSKVLDENGKPVKALRADNSEPAEVKMANWLVTKGIAKDPAEAYKLVTRAKGSDATPAEIEKMVETATKTEIGDRMGVKPEQVQEIRERNRKRIVEGLGLNDAAPVADGADVYKRPDGVSDEDAIKQAQIAIKNGAPPDMVRTRLKAAGIDPTKAGL